nr:apolipoprotein N-acyltransferase [Desulfobacterales bacterium]
MGRSALSDIILSILTGLLLTASFPKANLSFLAWVALVPFFWAINGRSLRSSFWLGFISGLVHYLTLLYWIIGVTYRYGHLPLPIAILALTLLAGYLSLYPAFFAVLSNRSKSRSMTFHFVSPFVWVVLEYIRSFLLSGFPWEHLGYSQFRWLPLIQISDILGVYGVSALIVAINSGLFCTLYIWKAERRISLGLLSVVLIIMGTCLVYGSFRIKLIDAQADMATHRVITVVQGNIDQSKKWLTSFQNQTIDRYRELSLSALPMQPDLIVWPETALPFYFLYNPPLTEKVLRVVRCAATYFIVGSPAFESHKRRICYYNRAYLISPEGKVVDQYDKVHLVPFGEYVPLRDVLFFVGKIVPSMGEFCPGKKGKILTWESHKIGPLICFEIIFPELARSMVKKGANILVTITNDAWFDTSSAPYQHFSMVVFRAVENRVAVVRAANTGISGFVDPAGRILEQTPLFKEAIRTCSLPMMSQETFYTRFGDVFVLICFLITIIFIFTPVFRKTLIQKKIIRL